VATHNDGTPLAATFPLVQYVNFRNGTAVTTRFAVTTDAATAGADSLSHFRST
jgi:hypothetical protein